MQLMLLRFRKICSKVRLSTDTAA